MIRYAEVNVGDALTAFTTPPITRTMLALYAGASGDHNPMHIDIDFAKKAGMDDVFAHGMLVMAFMGRTLTNWTPQTALRQFGVRFVAITHVHDVLTCNGKIVEKFERDGEQCVRLELSIADQAGERKLTGEAVVALSS